MSLTTENLQVEQTELYYYFNNEGEKFYTGDLRFAKSRAEFFGTDKVFVEKIK